MTDKTDRELIQQALNDLEALVAYIKGGEPDLFMQVPSIEALRERLAQPEPLQRFTDVQQEIEAALTPEQDPVAYVIRTINSKSISDEIAPTGWSTFESKMEKLRADPWVQNGIAEIVPLYTSPQQREWQGLTNEEISAISKSIPGETDLEAAKRVFARAIEAKLKEKNT